MQSVNVESLEECGMQQTGGLRLASRRTGAGLAIMSWAEAGEAGILTCRWRCLGDVLSTVLVHSAAHLPWDFVVYDHLLFSCHGTALMPNSSTSPSFCHRTGL